ncbi:hypothetical protein V5N11_001523 [Cardamine amara subsp. amara]|uniref:Transposase MuDR plant domain-containing protein n=1 Tax=Cardamine amara subsp. amara TaxID=228776 RepID=A0ABD0ZW93_CARAN
MALVVADIIPPIDEEPGPDIERDERYEFQVEEVVANFKDEPSVRHDVYPESANDDEEADVAARSNIRRGDGMLYENQKFYNRVAFKEVVMDYALKTGRNISRNEYDKTRLEYKCLGTGCKLEAWRSRR